MPTQQSTSAARRLPLENFRVLDLATMIAGPFCAGILGEFGAEVIKVEQPGTGDSLRSFGTMTAGGSLNWLNEARNKKSVTLDLRRPEGAALLKRLVAVSDVVVENFRPGTLERWGLGEEVLRSIKEDLVLIRISAYGQTGPYRDRPGFARVAHGFAGLSYLSGEPDGPPVVPGSTSLADYISGLYAALGAVISLLGRQRFGEGQSVDLGLYEGIFRMLDELAPAYAREGYVRERMGAETVNAVPHSHFRTADSRWVALACSSDKMFARLARVMGRPDLLAPDAFAKVERRVAHRAEVNAIVAQWIGALSCDEVMRRCLEGEVPIGPLNSIADIFVDPQIEARENLVTIEHPGVGPVTVPNVVPRLSKTPGRLESLGPLLGEHNEEILQNLLGLSPEALQSLRESKVI
jgi:crotonobetainyl-CoA:carnitine CoA-transferase CaiB-like acyl-CoA transferase